MKREDIPKHLRHPTEEQLKALFHLFRNPICMSNHYNEQHNEQELENIQNYVLEQDRKGLLDDKIDYTAFAYGLHPDDDRDEILEFIAESIFYEQTIGD